MKITQAFFLTYQYQQNRFEIQNFFIIPKYFFISDLIEKRKPLSNKLRKAGWLGYNILLESIPQSGKIYYVKNRIIESKEKVIENLKKVLFLQETKKELKR